MLTYSEAFPNSTKVYVEGRARHPGADAGNRPVGR